MMRFDRKRLALFPAAMTAVLILSGPASAQAESSRFPLFKAVPADVFIAVGVRSNPEREFLDTYWARTAKAFWDSGIADDVWDMVTDRVGDEELDQIEEIRSQFGDLLKAVDWKEVFGTEMVYAARFDPRRMSRGSPYEGVFLCRLEEKKAKKNYAAMKAVLERIGKMAAEGAEEDQEGPVTVEETQVAGATMTQITVRPGGDAPPMTLGGVGLKKDIVILSIFGDSLAPECLKRLDGSSEAKGLVDDPRFKSAFGGLPEAEDSMVFFDIGRMMSGMGGIMKAAAAGAGDNAEAQVWVKLIAALIDEFSVFDYMAAVERTEGYRVFMDGVTALRKDAKDKPLYRILGGGKAIRDFDRFIPEEAESFSVSAGTDWVALYGWVLGFIKTHAPDSDELLGHWAMLQEEIELDIEKDVLSLLAGPMASYSYGDSSVMLVTVTDEKKTMVLVKRMLNGIGGLMGPMGGLNLSPAKVAGREGFLQISVPMLAGLGGGVSPVIGCVDGQLLFGTSVDAVETCLKTAQGDHPRITRNERFKKEGLAPKSGAVASISFSDQSKLAEQLGEILDAASMGLAFAGMGMQQASPAVREVFAALPGILSKLGPVARTLDFFQSSASYSTFKDGRWMTHRVQNYRAPKPTEAAAEAETEVKPVSK